MEQPANQPRKLTGRLASLLLLTLAGGMSGCGSGVASTPAPPQNVPPALPQSVQSEIAKRFPLLAYVPTQLPPGTRYAGSFHNVHSPFGLTFSGTNGHPGFTFGAEKLAHARCPSLGTMHVFRLNGILVRWGGDFVDQTAWRCVAKRKVVVYLYAARSVAGDDVLTSPRRYADALQLARVLAYAKYIG